jgi:hypothetical protein
LPLLDRFRHGRHGDPFNTSKQDRESWQQRSSDAVSLWVESRGSWQPPGQRAMRIADFGAGNGRLRGLLAARLPIPHVYLPFDLHPQTPTTVRLNLEEEMPDEAFDLVFCLGVLEYLSSVSAFVGRLSTRCRFALVSFVYVGSAFPGGLSERKALGWRAHLDRQQLDHEFEQHGFSPVAMRTMSDGQTGLWLWAARDPGGP